MGNPPLRDHCCGGNGEPPAPTPIPWPRGRTAPLLWRVFRMREQGTKLSRAQAIETMRVGRLSVKMLYTPTAYLESYEGQVLGQLDDIRLRVLWETGAMMLHGRELGDPHSGPGGYPQAWWCELD